ncbi:MAG: ASCH domain-containing protein [Leptospirales bacterium]|nr:ASCH domain-containing protein [Leptospirales bacterium]
MDQKADNVALLSIRPEYAQKILSGEKKVEFRKRGFKRSVRHVLIYSTLPVGKVVGYFEIKNLEAHSPLRLWRLFSKIGGIDKASFDSYFAGKSNGIGITIKRVKHFDRPIPLKAIFDGPAPQDYAYLPASILNKLQY